jgi:hypothetical protein
MKASRMATLWLLIIGKYLHVNLKARNVKIKNSMKQNTMNVVLIEIKDSPKVRMGSGSGGSGSSLT